MTFADFVAGPTDRVFLAGKTGSGKTFAAQHLLKWQRNRDGSLSPRGYVMVYDAKGMLSWPGYTRSTKFSDFYNKAQNPTKFPKLIYAPVANELRDETLHEAFFRLAYDRKHTTVYVDEVYAVVRGQEFPASYHAILTRGREMHVPVFSATQRPKDLPMAIMSESDLFFIFRLLLPQDRKRISELLPIAAESIAVLPAERFYYYREGMDEATGPWRLNAPAPPKMQEKPAIPA